MVQSSCGIGMKSSRIHLKVNNGKQIAEEVITCGLQVLASIFFRTYAFPRTICLSITFPPFPLYFFYRTICAIIPLTHCRRGFKPRLRGKLRKPLQTRCFCLGVSTDFCRFPLVFLPNYRFIFSNFTKPRPQRSCVSPKKFAEFCDFFAPSRIIKD